MMVIVRFKDVCGAVEIENDVIVRTAPIFDWMLVRKDRSLAWLTRYAKARRWRLSTSDSQGVLL